MLRARALAGVAILLTLLVLPASPASADPAQPTNFRSRVLSASPALPRDVELRVVGGDAFLELSVRGDHEVVVPDYSSGDAAARRPYLRFGRDGTVERNDRSAAAAANESRFGTGANPDIGATPRWTVVSRDGRYAWHDHRIHWMLPQAPTAVDPDGRVDLGGPAGTWSIELVVDGTPTTVTGELVLFAAPTPLPWYFLGAAAAALVIGVALAKVRQGRPAPHRLIAWSLTAVSALALASSIGHWWAAPTEGGRSVVPLIGAAVALVAAGIAGMATNARLRLSTTAVAIAAAGGWALLRLDVLNHAVLPTTMPYGIDRAATVLALGVTAGATAVLVWHPPRS